MHFSSSPTLFRQLTHHKQHRVLWHSAMIFWSNSLRLSSQILNVFTYTPRVSFLPQVLRRRHKSPKKKATMLNSSTTLWPDRSWEYQVNVCREVYCSPGLEKWCRRVHEESQENSGLGLSWCRQSPALSPLPIHPPSVMVCTPRPCPAPYLTHPPHRRCVCLATEGKPLPRARRGLQNGIRGRTHGPCHPLFLRTHTW